MLSDQDHGVRHLGEALCGKCGNSLYGPKPGTAETYQCCNPECRNEATMTEIGDECRAWYAEFMDYTNQQIALGSRRIDLWKGWKPRGKYRFRLEILDVGHIDKFKEHNPIDLG